MPFYTGNLQLPTDNVTVASTPDKRVVMQWAIPALRV